VDFLWIEAFGGVSYVNLVQFTNNAFSGTSSNGVFNQTSGTGAIAGAALGFRVWWIAVGARASVSGYPDQGGANPSPGFQLGTVGGEVALRLPIPVVEPYIRAGFGYAWQGGAHANTTSGVTIDQTNTYGWAFNAALGLDIFLTNWFTIGAGVGFDVLNMARQTSPTAHCMSPTEFCPTNAGDAVGYQVSGFAQIGFHF
jgi:hypothetical protein